jgi:hypothetical protein
VLWADRAYDATRCVSVMLTRRPKRWLDVVGEVVAVGARRKERGRKQMSRSKLINRAGPDVADWWCKIMVVFDDGQKFVCLHEPNQDGDDHGLCPMRGRDSSRWEWGPPGNGKSASGGSCEWKVPGRVASAISLRSQPSTCGGRWMTVLQSAQTMRQ